MKNRIKFFVTLFLILFNLNCSYAQQKTEKVDSLEAKLKIARQEEQLDILIELIIEYYEFDIVQAIRYGKRAEVIAEKHDKPESKLKLYWSIGSCYYKLSDSDLSLKYFLKSLELCKIVDNKELESSNYHNIGAIYYSLSQYEKSVQYIDKSLKLLNNSKDYNGMAFLYSNYVKVYLKMGNSTMARNYLKIAMEINDKHLQSEHIEILNLSLLASIYAYEKKYNEGIEICENAIKKVINSSNSSPTLLINIFKTNAELYFALKNYKKAEDNLLLMIKYAQNDNSKDDLREAYKFITNVYEKMGVLDRAFYYQKFYISFNDSILKENQRAYINSLESKFEVEKMEKEIELLEEKELVSTQQKYLWFSGFSIVVLLLIALFIFYKNKLRKSKLEEELLANKLSFTQNELTTFALTLLQKNNSIEILKKELKTLNKIENIDERNKKVRTMILELSNAMGLEQDKILIQSKIKDLESKFLGQLENNFPNLSKNEKQLAVLLRANLSSKDIASIFNISHHSVNVSRYRLRKKLNLNQGDDLLDFLNKI